MDDLISRQAVLETLDDMDNVLDEDRTIKNYKELLKECYEVLPHVKPQELKYCDHNICLRNEYNNIGCDECEVTKSQEPSGDLINRQAVMDCFKKWQPYMATRLWDFEQELSALPSFNPQPCEDAMSREELLKAIAYKIWTSTEQIGDDYKYIKSISKPTGVDFDSLSDSQTIHHLTDKAYSELCLLAGKGREVLQAQADGDAISRPALLKLMGEEPFNWTDSDQELQAVEDYRNFRNMVEQLPSVKPQEKTGHWKLQPSNKEQGERDFIWWKCSKCGQVIFSETEKDRREYHAFCGRCGAKMVDEQERSDKE